jgi:hypothetical protein
MDVTCRIDPDERIVYLTTIGVQSFAEWLSVALKVVLRCAFPELNAGGGMVLNNLTKKGGGL